MGNGKGVGGRGRRDGGKELNGKGRREDEALQTMRDREGEQRKNHLEEE